MSVAESTRPENMVGVFSKTWQVFFSKIMNFPIENHEFPNPNDPQQIFESFFTSNQLSPAEFQSLDPVDCGCPTPDVLTWNQQPLLFVASSGNLRWNQILRHAWTCHFYKVIKLCFNSDELDQIKWSQLNVIPKLNHVWTWFIGYLLLSRTNPGIKTFSWTISWKRHPYTRYIPW